MEFVGYTCKEMLDVVNSVYNVGENCVIKDSGHFKLAIKMPKCNGVQIYALFVWNEFEEVCDEIRRITIQSKTEETIRFFQETTGIINDFIPRLLYHEVQTILRLNNGRIERYEENNSTKIMKENRIITTMEYDSLKNIWCVKISNVVTFTFDNENSALRVYGLITKDLSNFISFRWGRP